MEKNQRKQSQQKLIYQNLDQLISIFSWNILAPDLATTSQFPYTKPKYLNYQYRLPLIKKIIKQKSSNKIRQIISLQQCEPSLIKFLQQQQGFKVFYREAKNTLKKHGLLIGIKGFNLLDKLIVNYHDCINQSYGKNKQIYNKCQGAIFLQLEFDEKITVQKSIKRKIIIINTQIFWDPHHQKVKYHQVASLINKIHAFSSKKQKDIPIILTGDFNSLPNSNSIKLLQKYQIPDVSRCQMLGNKNIQDMKLIFKQKIKPLLSQSKSFLKFTNIFSKEDGIYTNFTQKFKGRIDYIFISETQNKKLFVKNKQKLPQIIQLEQQIAIPNRKYPSDHLPLICTILLQNQ